MNSKAQDNNNKDASKLLDKAICLLKLIASNRGQNRLSITGLSKELGVSRSTMYRILETLTAHQFVIKDNESGQYSLGWELCYLGAAAQKSNSLYNTLHPYLSKLSKEFGETVSISTKDDCEGLIIDTIRGTIAPLVVDVILGDHEPLHVTAYGKALLIDCSEKDLIELFGGYKLPPFAHGAPTSTKELYNQILQARKLGYTIAIDEIDDGVSAVACPIRDYSKHVAAAVSLATPTIRMTPEKISKYTGALIAAAKEMSKSLGYHK